MRAAPAVMIAAAAIAWSCWITAVPALVASAPPRALAWTAALTYRAGAVICHQQDARSFHIGRVRMPVCARCFGLYGGAAIGSLLAAAWLCAAITRAQGVRRLSLGRWRLLALAGAFPTMAAWCGEHLAGLAIPGSSRALLAVPLGAVVSAIVTLWAGGTAFDDTGARLR